MSGIGKCSLTAAIPVISCCKIECNPIPTAILSTHTGDLVGYTFRDLTEDMINYCNHWKSLDVNFDTIYTGYLGSEYQVEIVKEIISKLKNEKTQIIVDPAMADSGLLYKGFKKNFPKEMGSLCKEADVIVPNITEASLLTGIEYKKECDSAYIDLLLSSLKEFTKRYIVLTGVSYDVNEIGCVVYDKVSNCSEYYSGDKYSGTYYGTGDLFASALSAGITNGFSCFESAQIALEFTRRAIQDTYNAKTDPRFGVAFENHLDYLMNKFGGNK